MQALYEDSKYEDVLTCRLYTALESVMQVQKKKVIVGPNDSVGILLFNTVREADFDCATVANYVARRERTRATEIKAQK